MPHATGAHITITPEHVYINGEPVTVMEGTLKLSDPNPTALQTVTLTIIPTVVTILNDDNPDTINTTREATTHSTRDEASNTYSTYILPNNIADMLTKRKRQEAERTTHTQ